MCMWALITRKNLIIFGVLILFGIISGLIVKNAFANKDIIALEKTIEAEKEKVKALTDDVKERDRVITELNDELEKRRMVQEALAESVKDTQEKLNKIHLEYQAMKSDLNSSLDEIFDNPLNYENVPLSTEFDFTSTDPEVIVKEIVVTKEIPVKVKVPVERKGQLTKEAQFKVSEKIIDTMNEAYCAKHQCQ